MRLVLIQPQLGHGSGPENLAEIRRLVDTLSAPPSAEDVLLLPERFYVDVEHSGYLEAIRGLARDLGCHVVGGSHGEFAGGELINAGIACAPDGSIVGRYEKLRPYAAERLWAHPGNAFGEFAIDGRNVMVLICADFWFADVFQRARVLPDLVLVPALSVTRKPGPEYSRSLWRHLAIARAYEFGCYVGVSDWGHPSQLPALFASGVAGFADPTLTDPALFFQPVGDAAIRVFPVDFRALDAFRSDRVERGFFWKTPEAPS